MSEPEVHWDNEVIVEGRRRSWHELASAGPSWPAERVACVAAHIVDACAALAAGVRDSIDLLIAAQQAVTETELSALRASGYWVIRHDQPQPPTAPVTSVPGRITVLTSATTGDAKQIEHRLSTLATMSGRDYPARRWLWPYVPGTYAWYQLATLGLTVPRQTLVPAAGDSEWLPIALAAGVNAISATPTFWRRTLLTGRRDDLAALDLEQVTLGGEPVDQHLLDHLRDLWPAAQITHIYASTEAGACIAVSDGRAGFPAAWIGGSSTHGVRIRLDGDRLVVASPWASTGADEWIDTGDVVRVVEDRVEVVGRADGAIANVGGAKVRLNDIERVLDAHPDVVWARASARRAPIVGEMPVADVCLTRDSDVDEQALVSWCRARLPEVAVPRFVRVLPDIPTTAALKARV